MKAWSPPFLLNEELFTTALVNGAWATAYSWYVHWHNKLEGKPYAMTLACLQTFQAHGDCEVSDSLLLSWSLSCSLLVDKEMKYSVGQLSLHWSVTCATKHGDLYCIYVSKSLCKYVQRKICMKCSGSAVLPATHCEPAVLEHEIPIDSKYWYVKSHPIAISHC